MGHFRVIGMKNFVKITSLHGNKTVTNIALFVTISSKKQRICQKSTFAAYEGATVANSVNYFRLLALAKVFFIVGGQCKGRDFL